MFSQVSKKIDYQLKVVNVNGDVLTKRLISCKVNLLQGGTDGNIVYHEIHNVFTDENGNAAIQIGSGVTYDIFNNVNWTLGPFFIELSVDTNGGSNYKLLSTNQLMYMPVESIAQSASENILPVYSQSQIDSIYPVRGMFVFNSDYLILQMFNGNNWVGLQNLGCVPLPNKANAGADQYGITELYTHLDANFPDKGVSGRWEIISGNEGNFSDKSDPKTMFIGTQNSVYLLRWSLMTACDTSFDDVEISYWLEPPSVNYNGVLYIHPTDNSDKLPWGGYQAMANATSNSDGAQNTASIVSNLIDDYGVMYAAKLCESLNAFGFDDWYLPSKNELNAIYLKKDASLNFTNSYYWSSTEDGNNNAWYQHFGTGGQYNVRPKYVDMSVRCVRKKK